ncbi:MFS transporter [Agromyces atrinae]|uniref:MFS family permease n=2 Tax=Agromyces atrinae TaxID=592376 RepID=A0A852S6A0_9MICO|nr:MFS transporter [Agromyces atrinae]MCI2959330.1 MFS transporter [Agromyces atrinae]NYD68818.1 MFS family permease [Agromyces atrinae]
MTTPGTAPASPPAAVSEPTRRVGGAWISTFAIAWLGIWMAQLTPVQLLLPAQIDAQLHPDDWTESVFAFGAISGLAAVAIIIAYPLTGALSDRTTSRFGRRRPWILVGALVFAGALVALGFATDIVQIALWWILAMVGFCIMTAALTATISDQVPIGQRGFVSGWLSAPQAIGTILGLVIVTEFFTGPAAGYAVIAVLLIAFVLPFLTRPDIPLDARTKTKLDARGILGSLWISPRKHPDFGWTLLGRILVNIGNALGTGLLLYFLMFELDDPNAEENLIVLTLVYMVFVIIAALVLGRLSDRIGRRRAFVFVASALQGVAALLLAFVPSLPMAMVAAGFLGLGYGCFLAVDQALATQVLPDPASRGKDLGIMNIASAVPQAIGPLLGALAVVMTGSFTLVFVLAALCAFAGAAAVWRVRSVR